MVTKIKQTELDADGLRLLRLLVERLPQSRISDPRTFITYKAVHEALKLPQSGTTFGESLKVQGLNNLALWSASRKMPGITGLIIDSANLAPGAGYFELFKRAQDDYDWWLVRLKNPKLLIGVHILAK